MSALLIHPAVPGIKLVDYGDGTVSLSNGEGESARKEWAISEFMELGWTVQDPVVSLTELAEDLLKEASLDIIELAGMDRATFGKAKAKTQLSKSYSKPPPKGKAKPKPKGPQASTLDNLKQIHSELLGPIAKKKVKDRSHDKGAYWEAAGQTGQKTGTNPLAPGFKLHTYSDGTVQFEDPSGQRGTRQKGNLAVFAKLGWDLAPPEKPPPGSPPPDPKPGFGGAGHKAGMLDRLLEVFGQSKGLAPKKAVPVAVSNKTTADKATPPTKGAKVSNLPKVVKKTITPPNKYGVKLSAKTESIIAALTAKGASDGGTGATNGITD